LFSNLWEDEYVQLLLADDLSGGVERWRQEKDIVGVSLDVLRDRVHHLLRPALNLEHHHLGERGDERGQRKREKEKEINKTKTKQNKPKTHLETKIHSQF